MNFHSEMPPEARGKAAGKSTGRLGGIVLPEYQGALLALDLGSRTGWALALAVHVRTDPWPLTFASGYIDFKGGRFEGGGMRFLRFRNWLTEMKQGRQIGLVVFEEVRRHQGVDAAHVYGGLMAMLTSWCEHHEIPYQGVPVGSIKKHATGKGNANKDAMIAAARERGPCCVETKDDNEADAICLLNFALEGAGV